MGKLRGGVDDPPRALLLHLRDHVLHTIRDAPEVDVQHAPPDLGRLFVEWGIAATNSGIVDQDVEPAELPDRLRDPKWLDPAWMVTPAAKEEAEAIVYPWMLSHTRHEVWEAARRSHAMVAPLYTARDMVDDPVLRRRGLWTEIEHVVLGRLPMIGRPYMLERTPWRIRSAAPSLPTSSSRSRSAPA